MAHSVQMTAFVLGPASSWSSKANCSGVSLPLGGGGATGAGVSMVTERSPRMVAGGGRTVDGGGRRSSLEDFGLDGVFRPS